MRNRILKGWGEIHIIFTPLQILFILSKHHDTLRCIFFFRDSRERGRKVRRKFKFSLEKKKEDIRIILKFIFKAEVIRIFDIIENILGYTSGISFLFFFFFFLQALLNGVYTYMGKMEEKSIHRPPIVTVVER